MKALGTLEKLARLARTVRGLHPLQVAARVPHAVIARMVRDVPSFGAPELVSEWPEAPAALRAIANDERARGAERIARLPSGSRLRAYEATYGLELGDGASQGASDGDALDGSAVDAHWRSAVAVEPFPASVRARRIAVATRLGRRGLGAELARACRAVALQLEVHLLGNHLLENGFALACGGAAARGVEADAWWSLGSALLAWQLDAQFLPDGGHFERSASYHLALTHGLLEAIELADASGRGAPAAWRLVASRALAWAEAVRAPDGAYPLFNDASLDAAPSIDAVLALGRACGVGWSALEREESGGAWVRRFPDAGWLGMGAPDGAWLMLDAGPDGAPYQPGHAHADALTFELWVRGARAIVDYGVASYANDEARKETRATRSHNTMEIASRDASEVWGAFRVGRRAHANLIDASAHDGVAHAEATHDGYRFLEGRPTCRRRMQLSRGALDIVDDVTADGAQSTHAVTSRVRIDPAATPALRITGEPGPTAVTPGLWYPRQGERRDALVHSVTAPSPDNGSVRWRIEW